MTSESTTVDSKGRLLIPKRIREAANIRPPTKVLAMPKGSGRIEIIEVDPEMKRAREIARKKLARWKEEEHEAEKLALELASHENR